MNVEVLLESSPLEVSATGTYTVEVILNTTINTNGEPLGQIYASNIRYTQDKTVEQALNELYQSIQSGDITTERFNGVSQDGSITIPVGSKVLCVDFVKVSGNPIISLGRASDNMDILIDFELSDTLPNEINTPFKNGGFLFYEVNLGVVNIIMRSIKNFYS